MFLILKCLFKHTDLFQFLLLAKAKYNISLSAIYEFLNKQVMTY